jgi:hypothetical protein
VRSLPDTRTLHRIIGVTATVALLGVAIASASMIASSGDEQEAPAAAAPVKQSTRTPTPTSTPKPKPPPLTALQREQRAAAVEMMRANGFEPVTLAPYRGDRELRVLVGRRAGAAPGTPSRRAFFFMTDQFVGTDTQDVSGRIVVVRNGQQTVTLAYGRYEPGDVLTDPSGRRRVRFKWNGSAAAPETPVPPATERVPQPGAA